MIDTEQLNLGPLQLHWLDKSKSIDDLPVALTDDEKKKADTIKAEIRREEFVRSRLLLRSLTKAKSSFLPDAENSPGWPEGMCGSITHKNGHVAVCTESTQSFNAIGIDSENAEKDISHLQEKICTENDLKVVERICKASHISRGSLIALIFSAKEALFKCHYPLGKKMFWFHDAEVSLFDWNKGDIEIKVLIDTSPMTKMGHITQGKFLNHNASDGAFWVTAFTLPKS